MVRFYVTGYQTPIPYFEMENMARRPYPPLNAHKQRHERKVLNSKRVLRKVMVIRMVKKFFPFYWT